MKSNKDYRGLTLIIDSIVKSSNNKNTKYNMNATIKSYELHKPYFDSFIKEYCDLNSYNLIDISAVDDLGFDEIDENEKINPPQWYKDSADKNNIVLIKDIDELKSSSKKLNNLNNLILYNNINGVNFAKEQHHFTFLLFSDKKDISSIFEKTITIDLSKLN